MSEEVSLDAHHIAYTRVRNGKVETIAAKGFNPTEDKTLRVHVGKKHDKHMKHVGHVAEELGEHVVTDPKTKQPFTVGAPKEVYEENEKVMVAGFDSDDVMTRHFHDKNFDPVVRADLKELQDVGDVSRSNSDEISDFVKNHYNEHIGTIGYVQTIIPASENKSGEDLYGVVALSDHDADGNFHMEDNEGNKVNRNHLHYYKSSDLLPANPNEQGEHSVQQVKGRPDPNHKYIRREIVNGEYRYIYELPSGEHKAYDEAGYLQWVKGKRDAILSGDLSDTEGFSTWRDDETGELNIEAIEELSDQDLIAYGGAIAQNYHQDEWINHTQDQMSLMDAESIKDTVKEADDQIPHLLSLLDKTSAKSIATADNKTPIELTAVQMDASGMLMRDKKGRYHPDRYILDRIHDGFLDVSEDTKIIANVLSDYLDKMKNQDLTLKSANKYKALFHANPEFDDMLHLSSFEALKMLAMANDESDKSPWSRGDVQKSLTRGKTLMAKGQIASFLSQEDKDKQLEDEKQELFKQQVNRKLEIPKAINLEIETEPGVTETITPHFFQKENVNWMLAVGNGINGSGTGQGKTFQTILATETAIEKQGMDGSIIFALPSVQGGWSEEIKKYVHEGEDHHVVLSREEALNSLSDPEILKKKYIVLPYSLKEGDMNDPEHRKFLKVYEEVIKNRLQFFDEGRGLRYEDAQIYKSLSEVAHKGRGIIILNATPMAGDPKHIHAQMALLHPGLLPEWQEFKALYTMPLVDAEGNEIDRTWDWDKATELYENVLKPYMYIRRNEESEIAKVMNLPEKRERGFRATMTGFQKTLHDQATDDMLLHFMNKNIDEDSIKQLNNKFMLQRKISFHPRMVEDLTDDPEMIRQIREAKSAKWENALDGLRVHFRSENEALAKGDIRKVRGAMIPVAQVKILDYMVEYFTEQLGLESHEVGVIRGGMPNDERERIRQGFNAGDIKVLFVSQQAASYGMNAQKNCNHIEEFDDPYNAITREQYLARVIRMGNKAPHVTVNVHRDPESADGYTQNMIVSKSKINFMFMADPSSTPIITTEDNYLKTMMGLLKEKGMTLEQLNEERAKRGLPPHTAPQNLKKSLNINSGLSTIDKLLLAYSQPLVRAKMGQEKWNKVKEALRHKAYKEGKTLPDYFEEEEVMDLGRTYMNDFEEEKQWAA